MIVTCINCGKKINRKLDDFYDYLLDGLPVVACCNECLNKVTAKEWVGLLKE